MMVAMAYAFAGEKERTMDWLEIMYETGNPNMPAVFEPDFGLVFDEPRFQELRRRMGLPQ
jgi:hypothetical protein